MIVAGVMSGTSADGVNVALMRVTDAHRARSSGLHPIKFELIGHAEYPYPKAVRRFVLATMNSQRASVADLARLNFLLGHLYADAVTASQRRFRVKAELIGCHGQTIYHQGDAASFLGRNLAVTWQTGEGAVIAARVGVSVVSDFRPADMAVGGHGAPLVPFLDMLLYRDRRIGRIVQNIGGIANLTAVPAGTGKARVIAFDTGPGNMLIDAVMERLLNKQYDRDGRVAAAGKVLDHVVKAVLGESFFHRKPPKTAGREEFGREFAKKFVMRCGRSVSRDIVATATALTARSIADSLERFVLAGRHEYQEYVVSGGGTKNSTLMRMLAAQLQPLGLKMRSSDEFGLPSEAKEAAAFALLAFETWHRRPSNVPSATAAKRPAILGKISYA